MDPKRWRLDGQLALVTGSSAGALWFFAGCLILSSFLVIALPAKLVNR